MDHTAVTGLKSRRRGVQQQRAESEKTALGNEALMLGPAAAKLVDLRRR